MRLCLKLQKEKKKASELGMVVHSFKPSILEAEPGGPLEYKAAWTTTERVQG